MREADASVEQQKEDEYLLTLDADETLFSVVRSIVYPFSGENADPTPSEIFLKEFVDRYGKEAMHFIPSPYRDVSLALLMPEEMREIIEVAYENKFTLMILTSGGWDKTTIAYVGKGLELPDHLYSYFTGAVLRSLTTDLLMYELPPQVANEFKIKISKKIDWKNIFLLVVEWCTAVLFYSMI